MSANGSNHAQNQRPNSNSIKRSDERFRNRKLAKIRFGFGTWLIDFKNISGLDKVCEVREMTFQSACLKYRENKVITWVRASFQFLLIAFCNCNLAVHLRYAHYREITVQKTLVYSHDNKLW